MAKKKKNDNEDIDKLDTDWVDWGDDPVEYAHWEYWSKDMDLCGDGKGDVKGVDEFNIDWNEHQEPMRGYEGENSKYLYRKRTKHDEPNWRPPWALADFAAAKDLHQIDLMNLIKFFLEDNFLDFFKFFFKWGQESHFKIFFYFFKFFKTLTYNFYLVQQKLFWRNTGYIFRGIGNFYSLVIIELRRFNLLFHKFTFKFFPRKNLIDTFLLFNHFHNWINFKNFLFIGVCLSYISTIKHNAYVAALIYKFSKTRQIFTRKFRVHLLKGKSDALYTLNFKACVASKMKYWKKAKSSLLAPNANLFIKLYKRFRLHHNLYHILFKNFFKDLFLCKFTIIQFEGNRVVHIGEPTPVSLETIYSNFIFGFFTTFKQVFPYLYNYYKELNLFTAHLYFYIVMQKRPKHFVYSRKRVRLFTIVYYNYMSGYLRSGSLLDEMLNYFDVWHEEQYILYSYHKYSVFDLDLIDSFYSGNFVPGFFYTFDTYRFIMNDDFKIFLKVPEKIAINNAENLFMIKDNKFYEEIISYKEIGANDDNDIVGFLSFIAIEVVKFDNNSKITFIILEDNNLNILNYYCIFLIKSLYINGILNLDFVFDSWCSFFFILMMR